MPNHSQSPKRQTRRSSRKRAGNLLNKELKLCASPLSFLFLGFTALTLLPKFAILSGPLLVCIGIFYSFYRLRESGDLEYSVLLPLHKEEVVLGKYLFAGFLQGTAFLLTVVFSALRRFVLAGRGLYEGNILLPSNLTFLAFTVLIFAAFNYLFLLGLFRDGYKVQGPLLRFLLCGVLLLALAEGLHHVQAVPFLDGEDLASLLVQGGLLAVSLAVYFLLTRLAWRRSAAVFQELEF